jgi:hypothetical protein
MNRKPDPRRGERPNYGAYLALGASTMKMKGRPFFDALEVGCTFVPFLSKI